MTIEAWPFLVSGNKKLDYRTIVAPQFLYDAKLSLILALAATGDLSAPQMATYREIHGATFEVHGVNISVISILFRIILAEESYVGLEGISPLKDEVGREIYLIEGFVLQGDYPDMRPVCRDNFETAHRAVQPDYIQFWNWDSPDQVFLVRTSQPFKLKETCSKGRLLALERMEPFTIPQPEVKNGDSPEYENFWSLFIRRIYLRVMRRD